METLLKRHFWILALLGLAVLAYLAAGSVSALIGVQLAKGSRGDEKPQLAAAGGESGLAKRLRDGRLRDESGAVMAGRSMFLLEEPPPPPEEGTDEEPSGSDEAAAPPPDPTYEPTTLPIKLMGTLVVTPDTWSSATIELEKTTQKIVTVGMELLDGKATVVAIRRNYLVLREGDKLTTARMFQNEGGDKTAGGENPGGRPPPAEPRPTPAPARTADAEPAVQGVKKVGEGTYNLDRSHVNDKLKDVTTLGTQVRVVPNYKGGKYEGFRMIGMGGESLFKDIGFNNGDIVQAINGERIDSPNKALALYEALKNKARVTVLIERDGQPKTLRYTIK